MQDETASYRRDELYDEVWKEPIRTVAKRYGVSDVALSKICRRLRVPLPRRGHWNRPPSTRPKHRLPLPPLSNGEPSEIVAKRWKGRISPPRSQEPPIE